MSNKSVDVIIPTYNGLPYLKETVESVLNQTHKDFTLYIVDDGSDDDGATKKYAEGLADKRVQYVRKENGGQSTARNYGIRISEAPFITLLDSDDIWFPTKLERQLEVMEAKPEVGLVYGYHHFIDGEGAITGSLVRSNRGKILDVLVKGNSVAGSASMVMIRREVLDKVGLFKEDFLIGEDWEMWMRIAQDYELDFVPDFLAALRVLDDGMQQNYKKMADGLMYMGPVMLAELKLSAKQRQALTETYLWLAASTYYTGAMYNKARVALFKLFVSRPITLLKPSYWITVGSYTKMILGNPLITLIKKHRKPTR